jgi:hypothetical protein
MNPNPNPNTNSPVPQGTNTNQNEILVLPDNLINEFMFPEHVKPLLPPTNQPRDGFINKILNKPGGEKEYVIIFPIPSNKPGINGVVVTANGMILKSYFSLLYLALEQVVNLVIADPALKESFQGQFLDPNGRDSKFFEPKNEFDLFRAMMLKHVKNESFKNMVMESMKKLNTNVHYMNSVFNSVGIVITHLAFKELPLGQTLQENPLLDTYLQLNYRTNLYQNYIKSKPNTSIKYLDVNSIGFRFLSNVYVSIALSIMFSTFCNNPQEHLKAILFTTLRNFLNGTENAQTAVEEVQNPNQNPNPNPNPNQNPNPNPTDPSNPSNPLNLQQGNSLFQQQLHDVTENPTGTNTNLPMDQNQIANQENPIGNNLGDQSQLDNINNLNNNNPSGNTISYGGEIDAKEAHNKGTSFITDSNNNIQASFYFPLLLPEEHILYNFVPKKFQRNKKKNQSSQIPVKTSLKKKGVTKKKVPEPLPKLPKEIRNDSSLAQHVASQDLGGEASDATNLVAKKTTVIDTKYKPMTEQEYKALIGIKQISIMTQKTNKTIGNVEDTNEPSSFFTLLGKQYEIPNVSFIQSDPVGFLYGFVFPQIFNPQGRINLTDRSQAEANTQAVLDDLKEENVPQVNNNDNTDDIEMNGEAIDDNTEKIAELENQTSQAPQVPQAPQGPQLQGRTNTLSPEFIEMQERILNLEKQLKQQKQPGQQPPEEIGQTLPPITSMAGEEALLTDDERSEFYKQQQRDKIKILELEAKLEINRERLDSKIKTVKDLSEEMAKTTDAELDNQVLKRENVTLKESIHQMEKSLAEERLLNEEQFQEKSKEYIESLQKKLTAENETQQAIFETKKVQAELDYTQKLKKLNEDINAREMKMQDELKKLAETEAELKTKTEQLNIQTQQNNQAKAELKTVENRLEGFAKNLGVTLLDLLSGQTNVILGEIKASDKDLKTIEGLVAQATTKAEEIRNQEAFLKNQISVHEEQIKKIEENKALLESDAVLKDEALDGLQEMLGESMQQIQQTLGQSNISSGDLQGANNITQELQRFIQLGNKVKGISKRFQSQVKTMGKDNMENYQMLMAQSKMAPQPVSVNLGGGNPFYQPTAGELARQNPYAKLGGDSREYKHVKEIHHGAGLTETMNEAFKLIENTIAWTERNLPRPKGKRQLEPVTYEGMAHKRTNKKRKTEEKQKKKDTSSDTDSDNN